MESTRYMANVITAANLLFGAMSIFLCVIGKYVPAAWIIFFALIFDITDGKIARLGGNGLSEFGKQFDSLADLVSFVLAPSVLVFVALPHQPFFLWRLLACLIAIFCGAFRLARFNTEAEDKIALFFNGLPSPAFGALLVSLVLVQHKYNFNLNDHIISIIITVLAMMMVSSIKYPTFKNLSLFGWKYLIGFVGILAILFIIPELGVFILSLTYVAAMPIKAGLMDKSLK